MNYADRYLASREEPFNGEFEQTCCDGCEEYGPAPDMKDGLCEACRERAKENLE